MRACAKRRRVPPGTPPQIATVGCWTFARLRHEDVRCQLESVDAEIRWATDAARNQVEAARLAEERTAEEDARIAREGAAERQKSLERLVGRLGTALVIAALIPSLFGDTVKLPDPDRLMDFIGMVLVMVGLAGFVLCRLTGRPNDADARGSRRRLSVSPASDLVAVSILAVGVGMLAHVG